MPAAAISRIELFERLAAGHAAGVCVVTPNRRLAQELARGFDRRQAARGLAVWETADILPLGALFERIYDDALYAELPAELPLLLTAAQEAELWRAAIGESAWAGELLALEAAAAQCAQAWRLAHAWRIDGALASWPGNEDAQAFAGWARSYLRRCERDGLTDAARLADLAARLLKAEALRKPQQLVAYAFDIVPPQVEEFFGACAGMGVEVKNCSPEHKEGASCRRTFHSAREELETAARWARARLEEASSPRRSSPLPLAGEGPGERVRIGVVVPDLEQRRKEVARIFSRAMQPDFGLPGAKRPALPFNISLGVPLADYPIVDAALGILGLAQGESDFARASRLMRSPFLGGADSEMAARARLDARLRKIAAPRVTLGRLIATLSPALSPGPSPASGRGEERRGEEAHVLMERLDALLACARANLSGQQSPHDWGRHIVALLEAAGFPGERALDSEEFQARAKFNEALAELANLEHVVPKMSYAQALARLRRLCADTLFQPESADAPIQVLGILESAGIEFDRLWVSGLTDEAWPLAARPNPFIAPALQRKAGVPEASAEASLALDRHITQHWLAAADEVVLSHATREADRELAPSPLIKSIQQRRIGIPETGSYRDVLHAAGALEDVVDEVGPPLPSPPAPLPQAGEGSNGEGRNGEGRNGEGRNGEGRSSVVRGGTRVLADQAACPFRAFARHRLGAEPLESPAAALDASDRGRLLHELMSRIWAELKSKAGLDAVDPDVLAGIIDQAAEVAVARLRAERPGALEDRFAALERVRLAKLAREWLQVERRREPFEVVAREEKRILQVAGLSFAGRIDRMDRLEGGGHALIDYKSGRTAVQGWLGERPDDPQLPLYAVTEGGGVDAVAFAKLKTGEMRFEGLARGDGLLPKVRAVDEHPTAKKHAATWDELLGGWRKELESLGKGFASGDARVDPKDLLNTCKYCGLQPVCRVYERISPLTLEDDGFSPLSLHGRGAGGEGGAVGGGEE